MKGICAVTVFVACQYAQLAAAAPDDAVLKSPAAEHCASCELETTDESGPYCCPLFPIMYLSSGTVYYCDYFDPDCEAEVEAAYAIGEYDYPMECPDCLVAPSLLYEEEFFGLANPITPGENSLKLGKATDTLLGDEFLSGGSDRTKCRSEMAGIIRLSADGRDRFAIALKVEFSRGNAKRSGTPNVRDSRFIALEIDRGSDNQGNEVTDAVSPQRLSGGFAYRAKFDVDGQSTPVLILLARSERTR